MRTVTRLVAALTLVLALPACDMVFGVDPPADAGAAADATPARGWREVATGRAHTCAILDADASLWCWGNNNTGQLGDGTGRVSPRPTPVYVTGGRTWTHVAAGGEHTCAIDDQAGLWCWGRNDFGQLGVGSTTGSGVPALVMAGQAWSAIAAGDASTCAIRTDTTLWCWGHGDAGRLGTGSTADQVQPQPVAPELTGWTKIALSDRHGCGLVGGQVHCWGRDAYGQVTGMPAPATPVLSPQELAVARPPARDVAVGSDHTCVVLSDGVLQCWGSDGAGQFGDGSGISTGPVVNDAAGAFTAIAAGLGATCGLRAGGLACWGENYYGTLGLGSDLFHWLPVDILPGTRWRQVTVQHRTACALTTDGALYCTGSDSFGQLGLGTGWASFAPVRIATGPVADLTVGRTFACEVRGGVPWCWGANSTGELAVGDHLGRQVPTPSTLVTGATAIAAGDNHGCAARADLPPLCWGFNGQGALGDGSTTSSDLPRVAGTAVAVRIDAGRHTCALGPAGLQCWGENGAHQVHAGSEAAVVAPSAILGNPHSTVAAGDRHTCVTRADQVHEVVCWGDNSYGQLGTGSTSNPPGHIVVQRPASKQVVAGDGHTCALADSGALSCWGRNDSGQAGGPSPGLVLDPTATLPAPGGGLWQQVAAGARHTCALTAADELFCWGDNGEGQLATERGVTSSAAPQRVVHPDGGRWRTVAAGGATTCARDDDDSTWCWGANWAGQAGTGLAWRTEWTAVP